MKAHLEFIYPVLLYKQQCFSLKSERNLLIKSNLHSGSDYKIYANRTVNRTSVVVEENHEPVLSKACH